MGIKIGKFIVGGAVGLGCGLLVSYRLIGNRLYEYQNRSDKFEQMFHLCNRWMMDKQKGRTISDYLQEHHYNGVAIYGMNYLGRTLLTELRQSQVDVRYAVDRSVTLSEIDIYRPDEALPDVDLMIVTAVFDFKEIKKMMTQKVSCPVVSLEDII